MNKYFIGLILILAVGGVTFFSLQKGPSSQSKQNKLNQEEYIVDLSDMFTITSNEEIAPSSSELSNDETKWLVHMREEEKLARDVYTSLGEKYNSQIFLNIAASEQTHTDSIKTLLNRYNIKDPSIDNSLGSFTSPELKDLYTSLTEKGYQSLNDALIVGATIEDLDISDLNKAMETTKASDILNVYKNLQKGSRNHLRGFIKNINKNNATYSPQYISNDEYQSILSTSQEKGRVN